MLRFIGALLIMCLGGLGLFAEVKGWGPDAVWALLLLGLCWGGPIGWEVWRRLRERDVYAKPITWRLELAVFLPLLALTLRAYSWGSANTAEYASYRSQAWKVVHRLEALKAIAMHTPIEAQAYMQGRSRLEEDFADLETAVARCSPMRPPRPSYVVLRQAREDFSYANEGPNVPDYVREQNSKSWTDGAACIIEARRFLQGSLGRSDFYKGDPMRGNNP